MMLGYLSSKIIVIVYGMLYPAFCSYKAVKEKDVRAYVHWMMYWIVFALYSTIEILSDSLLAFWFPFYYELKIIFFLWLILPATRGASFMYRRLIHPAFLEHEEEIDSFITDFKKRTTDYLYRWASQLMTSISENIWQAAVRARSPSDNVKSVPTTVEFNNKQLNSVSADNSPSGAFDFDWNRLAANVNNAGWLRSAFSINELSTVVQKEELDEEMNDVEYYTTPDEQYEQQGQGPTTRSRGVRKKKETTNAYGTLPRTRKSGKRVNPD